jgi:hypothetical protein
VPRGKRVSLTPLAPQKARARRVGADTANLTAPAPPPEERSEFTRTMARKRSPGSPRRARRGNPKARRMGHREASARVRVQRPNSRCVPAEAPSPSDADPQRPCGHHVPPPRVVSVLRPPAPRPSTRGTSDAGHVRGRSDWNRAGRAWTLAARDGWNRRPSSTRFAGRGGDGRRAPLAVYQSFLGLAFAA